MKGKIANRRQRNERTVLMAGEEGRRKESEPIAGNETD